MFNKADPAAAALPKSVQVGAYTVHKLVLREYITVFERLDTIPQEIAKLDQIDEKNFAQHVGKIVAKCLPEVVGILAIITKEDPERLLNDLDLSTAVDLAAAASQVNDFLGVAAKIRGMIPSKKQTPPAGDGSSQ
jgi:RNA-binding protein YhbY